jgi:hypothetical protein
MTRNFNKQSPTQVVQKSGFWRRSILKANLQRAVEIPDPMCLVQNFKAVSTAQISDISENLSPIVREFSGIRNGKNRENTNWPPYIASFFLGQKAE